MNPNLDDWVSFVAMDLAVSPDGNFLLVATGVTDTCCHSTHDVILPMGLYAAHMRLCCLHYPAHVLQTKVKCYCTRLVVQINCVDFTEV
eukprot:SAG25_NODE_1962_length_2091_cov_5.726941_2_plen_88_part_01